MGEKKIITYKGMRKDMTCDPARGKPFQYRLGESYETDKALVCNYGFHGCENPLDVLSYYNPSDSRYFMCEQSGKISREETDSKIASTKIKIIKEISLKELIEKGVHAVITGDCANAATTGDCANAATTGDCANAVTTGYRANAVTTGNYSRSEVRGKNSIAAALGNRGKAKGTLGCFIVLAEYDDEGNLVDVKSHKVDGEKIKPDTWYELQNGELKEVK